MKGGFRTAEQIAIARETETQRQRAGEQAYQRPLTVKEARIVDLIANGNSNTDIAAALGLSEGTIKVYVVRIFEKLDIHSRFELIAGYWRERAGRCLTCGAALPDGK